MLKINQTTKRFKTNALVTALMLSLTAPLSTHAQEKDNVVSYVITNQYTVTYFAGENETMTTAKENARMKLANEGLKDIPIYLSSIRKLDNQKYSEVYATIQAGLAEVVDPQYTITTENNALVVKVTGLVTFDTKEVERKILLAQNDEDYQIQIRDIRAEKAMLSIELDKTMENFEQLPKAELNKKINAIQAEQAIMESKISRISPNSAKAKVLAYNLAEREKEIEQEKYALDMYKFNVNKLSETIKKRRALAKDNAKKMAQAINESKEVEAQIKYYDLLDKMTNYVISAPYDFEIMSIKDGVANVAIKTSDKLALDLISILDGSYADDKKNGLSPELQAFIGSNLTEIADHYNADIELHGDTQTYKNREGKKLTESSRYSTIMMPYMDHKPFSIVEYDGEKYAYQGHQGAEQYTPFIQQVKSFPLTSELIFTATSGKSKRTFHISHSTKYQYSNRVNRRLSVPINVLEQFGVNVKITDRFQSKRDRSREVALTGASYYPQKNKWSFLQPIPKEKIWQAAEQQAAIDYKRRDKAKPFIFVPGQ